MEKTLRGLSGRRALAASLAVQAQLGKLNGRYRAFRGFSGRSAPNQFLPEWNRADFAG
jgi:hypothetical protein